MNWKKLWFGILAIGIPLTLIAGQIRWYNDPGIAQKTVLTGAEVFSIQETSPNAYRWILADDIRDYTSGSATNPIQNLYVSNAYITNLYSSNIYSPNFYSSNIYTTNIEVRGKATINYINPVTNYFFYTTNLYLQNNYVSNYFTTNVLNDTYISNYLQQTFYTTNIYTTNLFSTNIVNNNSYVSNFWATNIFVTDNFVSNYYTTNMFTTYVTNIYSAASPWTTNNLGEIFPSDANFTNVWTRKPNTVFGYKANAIGPYNSAFGVSALANNQLGGMYNTAIGFATLSNNATGDFNTAVGYESQLNVTGSDNTSFGWRAMWNVITGGGNTAIGESCMDQQSAISEATTVGYGSLDRLTGIGNCAFGFSAFLGAVGAGTNNIAIGSRAGELASSIGSCIFIGYRAGYGASSITNGIGIGETATPTDNGQMVLGVGITNYVMGGISNFWPTAQNPGPLMNDGAGNLTYGIPTNVWANGPTGTVNLAVSDQNYSAGADMEITGVTGKGSTTAQNVLLTVLATGANRTLYLTGAFAESTGATSYVCTNGVPREIWIRYTPALGGWTNVCSLPFYRP